MTDGGVRRLAGWTGLGMVAFSLAQFPLYLMQDPSIGMYDGAAGSAEALRLRNVIFTRVLLDLFLYASGMVFAAGLAHLIRRADPLHGWAASLVMASMSVWLGVTLVANGFEGGLALDAQAPEPDPSVNRALTMGYVLIYNSSVAFVITALFIGSAGYGTAAARVLPSWTRWVAYGAVLLCAAAVPSMYAGPAEPAGFYNAAGWGPVVIANFPPLIWIVIASALLQRRPPSTVRPGLAPSESSNSDKGGHGKGQPWAS